jgi:hypothetical protein
MTPELLQRGQVFIAALLQALAGRVGLGRYVELRHELGRRFVDARVVCNHPFRELPNVLGLRPGLREPAGVDIDLVRRDHDRRDLRIGGPAGLGPGGAGAHADE